MLIYFVSEGGFVPMHLQYHADTAKLPDAVARELLELINSSGILDIQQGDLTPAKAVPDVVMYKLTLSEAGKSTTISFTDITAHPRIRPLLAFLQSLAMNDAKSIMRKPPRQ